MMDLRRDARRPGPWVVALAGLGLLVVLLLLLLPSARRDDGTLPPPPPPFLPAPSVEPPAATAPTSPEVTSTPVASGPPARLPAPARSVSRPTTPPQDRPATSTPPAEITVTGRYRVVDSFPDSFIGEVRVANTTGSDRDWTVRLRFPDGVGPLRTSWVESAPQASLTTAGDTFVWSSGAPVAARSSVVLRFHLTRSGADERPRACTVNGIACG